MSMIFNHVNFIYDSDSPKPSKAVNDVSFKINDGDFIGLIGHTGSGKSTLIQHMNGLLRPTSGEIYYNGEDITAKD